MVLQLIDEADLAAGESGLLVDLRVREGLHVQKGDVLAHRRHCCSNCRTSGYRRVDARQSQGRKRCSDTRGGNRAASCRGRTRESEEIIAQFPKSVSQSQLDVERLSVDELKLEVEAGGHELRLARLAEQVALQKLEAARLEISRRKLIAPFAGMAVAVEASVGEWVEPGQTIVRLVSTGRLKAEGFITAAEAARDIEGWQAVIAVPATDLQVTGSVVFVSPEIDPINKQVRVSAEVDNPDRVLRPGQAVDMRLVPPVAGDNAIPTRR